MQKNTWLELHQHAVDEHQLTPRQYHALIQFPPHGIEATCACGCGSQVAFFLNTRTFGKYLRGHISRIKNNWGHNEKVLEKSHQTMRKMRADGLYPTWTKGLTKETDERLAALGRKVSKTLLSNPEKRLKLSQNMKINRLNGTIPTLYGEDHPQWKGGTSSLNAECHGDRRLYREWKYPKLKAANFRCTRCDSDDNLCVHHDKETMSSIIHKLVIDFSFDLPNETHERKTQIINAIISYHIDNDVSGVVLCHDCHKNEHPSLNFVSQTRK